MNYLSQKAISGSAGFRIRQVLFIRICLILAIAAMISTPVGFASAVQPKAVSGQITDATTGEPLPGVNVVVDGTTIGVITDLAGNFSLQVPGDDAVLIISYIGYVTQKIPVRGLTTVKIELSQELRAIEEVVVIGYGAQKKQSVVGSIAVVYDKELIRRGGVYNLASAISGQIGGVTIMEKTGEPGREDPQILIRGMSTWNETQPLIMVDGLERRMSDIDINEVANISVLKDASATAVFGVKGANGVILITTKRGELGKPKLSFSANTGWKGVSRVNKLMEAYTAQSWRNAAVAYEVATNEAAWQYFIPYEQLMRSKKPQEERFEYIYPNVDWYDVMFKDWAKNSRLNVNLTGGTDFAIYFASLGYIHEGDLLKSQYNEEKGYTPGFGYDRFNFRGNLDFNLTKTTILSSNLSGYFGKRKTSNADFGGTAGESYGHIWRGYYELASDAFPVKYPDGRYGKDPANLNLNNPIAIIQEGGVRIENRRQVSTELKLVQKLDFFTKGLSVSGNVSYDTYVISVGPSIQDSGNQGQALYTYINPNIIDAKTRQDTLNATFYYATAGATGINDFDFVLRPWTVASESVSSGSLQRILFYQTSVNYGRTFGNHDVSGLLLFNRRQYATGGDFTSYREDWVGRVTYNYKDTYFTEFNGAYNGSEKFSSKYRFGFFPSMALGWMVSNEPFMEQFTWLDKFKIRGSIGQVGSDAGISRWGYVGSWNTRSGNAATSWFEDPVTGTIYASPYISYIEGNIANPDIRWETAIKRNLGFEISALERLVTFDLDMFRDNRKDIFMTSSRRNIPNTFGADAVAANLGATKTWGYEAELGINKTWASGFGVWAKFGMTGVKDEVTKSEDPALAFDYQKVVGKAISQRYSTIRNGYMNNWDDVFASVPATSAMNQRLPGDWDIVDFNGDGVIDTYDSAPFAYPTRPAKTYNAVLGTNYKGFSFMVQFFGVKNICLSPYVVTPSTTRWVPVSEELADYWTPQNTDAYYKAPRLTTSSAAGDWSVLDASFVRLKTVELSYTVPSKMTKFAGIAATRVYLNGNNLILWSDFPADIETGSIDIQNSYPTYKLINLGLEVTF